MEKSKKISDILGPIKMDKSKKSIKNEEEDFFMNLTKHLCQIEAVVAVLQAVGIGFSLENPFINSLRILMESHYGEMKANMILWWSFESISPEGDVYPIEDENGKEHILKTPTQLYKFLKRYDGK